MLSRGISLLIGLTLVSSISLAEESIGKSCRMATGGSYMGFETTTHPRLPDKLVTTIPSLFAKAHAKQKEIASMSNEVLMKIAEELIAEENFNYGGITGVREYNATMKQLIEDLMGQANIEFNERGKASRDMYNTYNTPERRKQGLAIFANYYRNELQAIGMTQLYPAFFRKVVELPAPSALPPIINPGKMGDQVPTDIRVYSLLLHREIIGRLISNPHQFLKDIGLEYPKDDSIFRKSMENLERAYYAP